MSQIIILKTFSQEFRSTEDTCIWAKVNFTKLCEIKFGKNGFKRVMVIEHIRLFIEKKTHDEPWIALRQMNSTFKYVHMHF